MKLFQRIRCFFSGHDDSCEIKYNTPAASDVFFVCERCNRKKLQHSEFADRCERLAFSRQVSEDKYVFDYVGKDNSVEQFDMSSDRYCSMTPIELYVNGADFNSIKFAITQLSCWQLQELEEIAQLYNDVDLLEFCRLCRNNFRNTEE